MDDLVKIARECGGIRSGTFDVVKQWTFTEDGLRALVARIRAGAPPDWKGYALLGTGHYAINHTAGPMDPELGAELIISLATEKDKAGDRQVGEERDTDPNAGPIMPEQMAVRIGFLSAAALDALESQLRHLRRENFPQHPAPTLPHPALDRANAGERESEGVQEADEDERLRLAGFDMEDDLDRPDEHCDCEKCKKFYAADPERREGAEGVSGADGVIASGEGEQ